MNIPPDFEYEVRPVPGYEKYSVANTGQIFYNGDDTQKPYQLKLHGDAVYLTDNGCEYNPCAPNTEEDNDRVVRGSGTIVAEAFLPNPDKKPYAMHLDHDFTNSHVCNLKWADEDELDQHRRNKEMQEIYTFENIITQETYTGRATQFCKRFNLDADDVYDMVYFCGPCFPRERAVNGWSLVYTD